MDPSSPDLAPCACCGQPLDSGRTCPACVQAVVSLLAEVSAWYYELPSHLGKLKAVAGGGRPGGADGRPLPGGDLLVMMGPGSPGYAETGETSRVGDAVSVPYQLRLWENSWRASRGEGLSVRQDVWSSVQYFRTHARWAGESYFPFPDFVRAVRGMHSQLESATGRRRVPERAAAPCFNCGGVLRRLVDSKGLEEQHVTCVACQSKYTPAEYQQALRAAVSSVLYEGEEWEPTARLASLTSRSANTLAAWRAEGLVRSHKWGGTTYLSVSDVSTQNHLRPRRK